MSRNRKGEGERDVIEEERRKERRCNLIAPSERARRGDQTDNWFFTTTEALRRREKSVCPVDGWTDGFGVSVAFGLLLADLQWGSFVNGDGGGGIPVRPSIVSLKQPSCLGNRLS